jgi:hypothetical protein
MEEYAAFKVQHFSVIVQRHSLADAVKFEWLLRHRIHALDRLVKMVVNAFPMAPHSSANVPRVIMVLAVNFATTVRPIHVLTMAFVPKHQLVTFVRVHSRIQAPTVNRLLRRPHPLLEHHQHALPAHVSSSRVQLLSLQIHAYQIHVRIRVDVLCKIMQHDVFVRMLTTDTIVNLLEIVDRWLRQHVIEHVWMVVNAISMKHVVVKLDAHVRMNSPDRNVNLPIDRNRVHQKIHAWTMPNVSIRKPVHNAPVQRVLRVFCVNEFNDRQVPNIVHSNVKLVVHVFTLNRHRNVAVQKVEPVNSVNHVPANRCHPQNSTNNFFPSSMRMKLKHYKYKIDDKL